MEHSVTQLRSLHFLTTNAWGAESMYVKGNVVWQDGVRWRVTKLRPAHDGWGGVKVYGRRVADRWEAS